jgi:stearoyl-CoA desaturase (delta-9 desaturase)
MSSRIPVHRINWVTSIFLTSTLLIALIGVPIYLWNFGIDAFQVALFIFYVYATGMSITLGYHRLFAHKAFKARIPVRLWTLVFGACAFENSALDWCSAHRKHHKHVDHEEDPYDISKGFFWAHIGWLLVKLHPERQMENVSDLRKDRLIMWQHRWVQLIAVVWGLVLPACIGFVWSGWEGALGSFMLAGILRIVVVQHSTFFINSLCHTVGRRPYSTENSARDSGIMAFFTFGEGYHNYHHAFQYDYRNGVKPGSFDPTKWAIWLMSKVGLTSNLLRVPPEKIVLAEMDEARRRAAAHLGDAVSHHHLTDQYKKMVEFLHELSESLAANCHELEEIISKRAKTSREVLECYRAQTKELLDHVADIGRLKAAGAFA